MKGPPPWLMKFAGAAVGYAVAEGTSRRLPELKRAMEEHSDVEFAELIDER